MIEMRNVSKYYEIGKAHALKGINLKFEDRKFYVIAGPSGSGKTTLLNIISGIEKPTKGTVIVDGKNIFKMKEKELRKFRLENIGLIFQFFYLIPYFTALENIMLPIRYSKDKKDIEKRAMKILNIVNGEHLKDKMPIHMSGGEMQRVAIARALANNPKYLIGDEPTANLDWENKMKIWNTLKEANRRGITVIVATHEREFFEYGDYLIYLKDGVIQSVSQSNHKKD